MRTCPLKPLLSLTWSVTADARGTLLLQGDSTWPGAQLTVTPPCHLLHIPVLPGAIWGQEAGAGARSWGQAARPRSSHVTLASCLSPTPDPRGPTIRAPDVPCCYLPAPSPPPKDRCHAGPVQGIPPQFTSFRQQLMCTQGNGLCQTLTRFGSIYSASRVIDI